MKADKETRATGTRNGAIDFLRFAASFILVLHHYQQAHNVFIDNGINFYSGHFYWGLLVDLFFVISGYFLLGSVTKIHDGDLKFKEYYLHRCVRLLPLVGVTAIIYFFVNNFVYFTVMGEYCKARSTGSELILSILGMQVGWANLEGSHLNPPMWYISALLIAFVVLYLIVSISGKLKKNYIIPVIGLILISMAGELFELNGVMTYKRAKVYTTTEFSSHAKQDELLDFMRQFTNLKTILVNHGDADVKKIFAKKITEEISPKHVAILGPNHTMRVGAYGLLKSYPFNS